MKIKTFFEYEHPKEDICSALGLNNEESRERFCKFLKKSNFYDCFSVSSKAVYPQSWVGSICYKHKQIEILPKLLNKTTTNNNVDSKIDEKERVNILNNLIFMLAYTHKLEIRTVDNTFINKSPNPFLEILIREFAESLFEALKRQMPYSYVRNAGNLKYLKGKLKITENIKYNCCDRTKFYCEYDEFSEHNALNRLFYWVTTLLKKISCNNYNQVTLTHILNYYGDMELENFMSGKVGRIKLTRTQEIFKKPFMLAKMFVEHASVDFSSHRINSIALLWDMNKLFEEFICEIIRHNANRFNCGVVTQKGRKLLKNDISKKRNTFVDILVKTKDKKIVIDTKYKKFASVDDFSNADVFQVSTYCLLHNAKHAILLYPQWDNEIKYDYLLNTDDSDEYHIQFETVDLKIKNLKQDLSNSDTSKICRKLDDILHTRV